MQLSKGYLDVWPKRLMMMLRMTNHDKFLFVIFGWKYHQQLLHGNVAQCSFPSLWWAHHTVANPCFQLQIEVIFVGICCFFSSMLYVYAENWISLHIKHYQIQNFMLKVISYKAWSKDEYSIYFSELQQSSISYWELLMNLVLIFLTAVILFLFSSLSQNA